jgi:hypothetical protein
LVTEVFLAGSIVVFASVTSIVAFSTQPIKKNRFGIYRTVPSQRAVVVPRKTTTTTILLSLSRKSLCHFVVVSFCANKDRICVVVLQSFELIFLTYMDVDTKPTNALVAITDCTLLDVDE